MNKNINYFYNVEDDLKKYPDAIYYVITGGRNTGKTYSTLDYMVTHKKKFIFLKRTMEDVKLMCASNKLGSNINNVNVDLSPFKSLNRDKGYNIKAFSIDAKNGIGGFYSCDNDGEPEEEPIGYILAFSSIYKIKGFDLSDVDFIIFDEFIPNKWEITRKNEGIQLAELYKTVSRAREHLGLMPLKVIMLANSTNINNSVFVDLSLVDIVAEMELKGESEKYLEDRYILIKRFIDSDFINVEEKSKIYSVMAGTKWKNMSLNNEFSNDDFSQIKKINLKNYRCIFSFYYSNNMYYCYYNENRNHYYFSKRKSNKVNDNFNLEIEIDQGRFYLEWVIDIHNECINGNCTFEYYSIYSLIMNYTRYFSI